MRLLVEAKLKNNSKKKPIKINKKSNSKKKNKKKQFSKKKYLEMETQGNKYISSRSKIKKIKDNLK